MPAIPPPFSLLKIKPSRSSTATWISLADSLHHQSGPAAECLSLKTQQLISNQPNLVLVLVLVPAPPPLNSTLRFEASENGAGADMSPRYAYRARRLAFGSVPSAPPRWRLELTTPPHSTWKETQPPSTSLTWRSRFRGRSRAPGETFNRRRLKRLFRPKRLALARS